MGVIAVTPSSFAISAMALSSSFACFCCPLESITIPPPEYMSIVWRFPKLFICSSKLELRPIPSDTITVMAQVPIITPIIARMLLVFLLRRFFIPIVIRSAKFISSPPYISMSRLSSIFFFLRFLKITNAAIAATTAAPIIYLVYGLPAPSAGISPPSGTSTAGIS